MEMSYRLWRAAAAIVLLSTGGALAQTAGVTRAKVESANAAWRKLSQSEVDCVDKALRARNSQIWMLIERGVGPGDTSVAAARARCGAQAKPPTPSAVAQNASASRAAEPLATPTGALQAAQANAIGSRMPSGYWSFNGSTLNMVAEGSLRKFFYAQLGPEAEAVGAQRGDLLLEGKVSDQRIVGTVYGHEGRCGRIPYRVDGTISDSNRRLELQGQKPRVDGSCTVVGTVLDALTFTSVASATAVAAAPPAARPDVAKPDVIKPAVARPAIERAAAVMAAADQATAERADADDATEFKIAPEKVPAERQAASRAAPVKVVLAAASESKVAANQAVAEKASAETAVQIARSEAARAQAQAEQSRSEAERAVAEAIAAVASAQSKLSFLYGLVSGPAVLGMGAMVLWLMRRRKQSLPEPSAS
jgi:hypothetical protein